MKFLLKPQLDLRRGSRFFISQFKNIFFRRGMDTTHYGEQAERKRWARTGIFFVSGLVFWLVTFVVLIMSSASPPAAVVEQAWKALSAARRAQAQFYAPALLQAAENRWLQATAAWTAENKKLFFRRNFQGVYDLAQTTKQQAGRAESTAVTVRDSLQFTTVASLAFVKQKVDEFKTQFTRLPVGAPLRKKFVAGELLMLESQFAFQREAYLLSALKVKQAEAFVGSAGSDATKFLRAYLTKVPEWQRWAAETIDWSAQNGATAIVVDKMAHACYVYVGGKKRAGYSIELGPRWLGHKRQKGDNATPEGHYYITKKKSRRQTKYYKALEINYPNDDDQQRFAEAKAKGELPRHAHIGALIEIHGDGGKGVNWTSGCVALRNQDIDQVFELAKVGARVTIVGSLKSSPTLEPNTAALSNRPLNGAAHPPNASN